MADISLGTPMDNFIKASSGHIYKDLGLPDADAMKRKAEIVSTIYSAIIDKNIPVEHVPNLAGITNDELESILYGHFRKIDYSQLSHLLSILGESHDRVVR